MVNKGNHTVPDGVGASYPATPLRDAVDRTSALVRLEQRLLYGAENSDEDESVLYGSNLRQSKP
jgi:hypothetical protein